MKHIFRILVVGLAVACTAFGSPLQLHEDEVKVPEFQVPDLPFADNPDPDACGIPERWGSDALAQLTGYYQRELVQPVVFLYDSHLRRAVTGQAKSGTKVRVLLFQDNPKLNFYFVKTGDNPQEGWVPAPFLRLEPSTTQSPPDA